MARKADDLSGNAAIVVVNPDDDTSLDALLAWVEDLDRADDWISMPTTAAELIDEDRSSRGS